MKDFTLSEDRADAVTLTEGIPISMRGAASAQAFHPGSPGTVLPQEYGFFQFTSFFLHLTS